MKIHQYDSRVILTVSEQKYCFHYLHCYSSNLQEPCR